MPELPEVEIISRALRSGGRGGSAIVGKTIVRAEVMWEKTIAEPTASEFVDRIAGQIILSVTRRAKYVVVGLSRDFLLFHLRMSGDIRVEAGEAETAKHDRLHLYFQDGLRLTFNDARKFGRLWLVEDAMKVTGGLGPEPFDDGLSAASFHHMLQQTRRQIKPLLLDQGFLAGVGNIYSDEALHRARIHPLTPANQISIENAGILLDSIRKTLEDGLRRNGASIDWVYRGGDFQNYFRVYQRTGEPCGECGTMIMRLVIGQRSAHFCPDCQRLES